MLSFPAGKEASSRDGAFAYERHRPEHTLLDQLVERCHTALKDHLMAQGRALPGYVEQEFEGYLKCGRLEHGFLRVRCNTCHAEHLVAFSCKRRGFCPSCGARRMAESADGSVRRRWVRAPTSAEPTQLACTIAQRVGRFLKRQGLLESDDENSYLVGEAKEAGPLGQLLGHSA